MVCGVNLYKGRVFFYDKDKKYISQTVLDSDDVKKQKVMELWNDFIDKFQDKLSDKIQNINSDENSSCRWKSH